MPLLGAHMSAAGGPHLALLEAQRRGCDTVQLFTNAPSQWAGKPLDPAQIQLFRQTLRQTKLKYPTAHDGYLINLASPDESLYRRSLEAFLDEMRRAEALGLRYLVTHPGAHLDDTEANGIARIARAIDTIHEQCRDFKVQILLETTAGQGTTLGHRFEHLADILSRVRDTARVGVCFDTCHVFAAGYELFPEKAYRTTMRHFDQLVGLKRLRLFHLNDSLKPLGSRVDRHAHIGQGHLGREPFRLLLQDARFRTRPMILETPKETIDHQYMDDVNLALLRELAGSQ
ncbi:MAG: deoxyribonuclease IV [Gemmataceae bacterium]